MAAEMIQTSDLQNTFKALRNQDPSKMMANKIPYSPDYKTIPQQNLAPTSSANTGSWGNGMAKFASGVVYGQPQFFSPVHTPINWQIPSKRLEQYQWARFFYENEPKVASAIDFYSYFPMNNYNNECKDRKIRSYFDKFKKRLELPKWTRLMSHEVHLLGDCFPFIEVSCPICGGSGRIGDELCEHEGGTVRRMVILNPDYVEVYTSPLNPEPVIALKPDEELINMVQKKTPGYERLTPEVIKLVTSGQPIRLDNRNVFHLKYGEGGYSKYGVGMVRRLFPILSYKTKLMVAQWIVAERLIVPIKVIKVGTDERPAGPADIAAVQSQLAQTANDPNLTIVTHHAFDLEWYGACFSSDTEVLTENGWKLYSDVSKNFDEKIATYNLTNNHIQYDIPQEYHQYDFNGEMYHFHGRGTDVMVTPNHNMLAQKYNNTTKQYGEWKKIKAEDIDSYNHHFKATALWNEGVVPEILPHKDTLLGFLTLDEYLEFVGYYVSEGGLKIYNDRANAVQISQCIDSPCFENIKEIMYKVGQGKVQEHFDGRRKPLINFIVNNTKLGEEIRFIFGEGAANKRIPSWIMSLPKEKLALLIDCLMDGDGSTRESPNGYKRYKYTTVSKTLADQIQEIVFKIGFSPSLSKYIVETDNRSDIYMVNWSELTKRNDRTINIKDNLSKEPYNGKVWCFTVPNGFFITRRNGKVTIQGNSGKVLTLSNEFEFINQEILDGLMINNALLNGEGPNFSSAAVGIEAMIERLETFRNEISDWIEECIYKPEAIRQGFVEIDPETEEEEIIYPSIKWNSMHLRDQQQHRTFMIQLYEKGLVSAQTVLETFDLDPDQEIERKRYDAVQMMALGQGMGQMGGAAGGGGGMPPMGGMPGDMGGMPGDMGGMGGMPGGDMGGGAPIAPGGDMGGAPAMASSSNRMTTANPSDYGGKVLKQKTRERLDQEKNKMYHQQEKVSSQQEKQGQEMRDGKGRIIFTKPERQLMDQLVESQKNGLIKYPITPQYEVAHVTGQNYLIDFAIPSLKIGIEADGEAFHSSPKQVQHDSERDMQLSQTGWTILRFSDTEIEKIPERVTRTIIQNIMQKELSVKKQQEDIKSG
ncbi:DUF559 domain-containing protein [bacterium]|nr:MAG: DUF559 domain-containing protein [bacterium]